MLSWPLAHFRISHNFDLHVGSCRTGPKWTKQLSKEAQVGHVVADDSFIIPV